MRDVAFETLAELLTVAVELLAAVVLTIVGLAAEAAGVTRLGAGLDALTLWYVFVGGLALYVGVYMLGYRTLLPQLDR